MKRKIFSHEEPSVTSVRMHEGINELDNAAPWTPEKEKSPQDTSSSFIMADRSPRESNMNSDTPGLETSPRESNMNNDTPGLEKSPQESSINDDDPDLETPQEYHAAPAFATITSVPRNIYEYVRGQSHDSTQLAVVEETTKARSVSKGHRDRTRSRECASSSRNMQEYRPAIENGQTETALVSTNYWDVGRNTDESQQDVALALPPLPDPCTPVQFSHPNDVKQVLFKSSVSADAETRGRALTRTKQEPMYLKAATRQDICIQKPRPMSTQPRIIQEEWSNDEQVMEFECDANPAIQSRLRKNSDKRAESLHEVQNTKKALFDDSQGQQMGLFEFGQSQQTHPTSSQSDALHEWHKHHVEIQGKSPICDGKFFENTHEQQMQNRIAPGMQTSPTVEPSFITIHKGGTTSRHLSRNALENTMRSSTQSMREPSAQSTRSNRSTESMNEIREMMNAQNAKFSLLEEQREKDKEELARYRERDDKKWDT